MDMIKPYTAKASHNATIKNALKNPPFSSASEEIAAVPTVFNAIPLPITAKAMAIELDNASIALVGLL